MGMMNISPIGRNCSRDERNAFEQYDLVCCLCRVTCIPDLTLYSHFQAHRIRETMVNVLKEQFADLNLTYSIGGQISFDVFPQGWDKTYCLNYIAEGEYDEIHFFGDKTFPGGNDYEIFTHPRVIGHTVTSPADTMIQCMELFMS